MMLFRIFYLLLFLVFAVNVNAQVNDAQNLTKDVRSLMYTDPGKAIKTAQYIVSNQSFGTTDDVYNALLLQSEIYSNSGYEDFSNVIGNVTPGQIHNFTTSSTTGSAEYDQVIVWIDVNQDGDFDDAGEKVLTTNYNASPWKCVITIPSTIKAG